MDLEVQKLLEKADGNFAIFDSVAKAHSVLSRYDSIACSISGGKDSDIMLDLISKIDKDRKVRYIWFDTGLEYQATKDHLKYLEEKYHIEIERIKAIKPIPLSCSEYGQPFLSKFVSDMICYTKYGMTRTGCVGCPFNRKLLDELSIIEEHEPKMLKAVSHVFKDSYEYTRMFREYVQKRKNEEKERTK